MEDPNLSDADEAARDQQLAAELQILEKERDDILNGSIQSSRPLHALKEQLDNRLLLAEDYRDYQLANLTAAFQVERQQAWNEFERGKRHLRRDILSLTVDRRKRIENIKTSHPHPHGPGKKKKRTRATVDRNAKQKAFAARTCLASLEKQGMVRVALTPDEVNSDLASILNGLDSTRTNGSTRPIVERTSEPTARTVDKIHSSRGILHYHDITYEKGDRVSILAHSRQNGSKLSVRYCGVMMSVNSKEIHIRTDDHTSHRVYVTHLRNGRFVLKPADPVDTAST